MRKATRKQAYHLTLADFNAVPVWEFTSDEEEVPGQDEATVRPYNVAPPIDTGHGAIVRAVFTLADGTNLRGYLSPHPISLRRPGWVQPVMISGAHQFNFWSGMLRPSQTQMNEVLAKIGKQASQVFPVQYRSDVELVSDPISGIIPGFGFIENKAEMFIAPDGSARFYYQPGR